MPPRSSFHRRQHGIFSPRRRHSRLPTLPGISSHRREPPRLASSGTGSAMPPGQTARHLTPWQGTYSHLGTGKLKSRAPRQARRCRIASMTVSSPGPHADRDGELAGGDGGRAARRHGGRKGVEPWRPPCTTAQGGLQLAIAGTRRSRSRHRTANRQELAEAEPTANRRELPLAGRAAACREVFSLPRGGCIRVYSCALVLDVLHALVHSTPPSPGPLVAAALEQLPRAVRCRIPHGQSSLVPCAKVAQSRGRLVRDTHGARG
jgi:hypothetical protein